MKNSFSPIIATLLTAVLLCGSLGAQDYPETGTIIVVAYSKQRIVIASDSKASFMAEGFQDEVCKISNPANQVLFAAAGMVGARDWNATLIAKDIASRTVGNNRYLMESTLQNIATNWARAMTEKIQTLDPAYVLKYQRESQTSAIFAGMDRADEINLVQVTLSPYGGARGLEVRANIKSVEVPKEQTRYLAMGRPAIAAEFLEAKSERARAEVAKWREYFASSRDIDEDVAIRLIDLTNHFDPRKDLVGGSTAALRMDGGGGVRWLKRPPSCF